MVKMKKKQELCKNKYTGDSGIIVMRKWSKKAMVTE